MITWEINNHTLEYIDEDHIYLIDGVIVPSITQILKVRFGEMYSSVDPDVLKAAADKGTEIHKAIEDYCNGIDSDLKEVRGFKWLQRQYNFRTLKNEVPVILYIDGEPYAAGRCDLVLQHDGKIGGADIKRTAVLNREYVAYQLNLYRMAYFASYGVQWDFIWAIHLRDDKRHISEMPINEEMAIELLEEYKEDKK